MKKLDWTFILFCVALGFLVIVFASMVVSCVVEEYKSVRPAKVVAQTDDYSEQY